MLQSRKYIYVNIDTKQNINNPPFNTTFPLDIPIVGNIEYVSLLNLQLPIGFYNIRSNCNTFYFKQGTTSRTATITNGNYNITSLLSALQTAINAVLVGATATITQNTITNKITISISTGTISIDNTQNPILNTHILGFWTDGQSGASITSPNCYNINHDLYINLSLDNLTTNFHSSNPCTFKIPISLNNGNILFYNEKQHHKQHIHINKNENLSYIKISVRDRYGSLLDNNNIHFSFQILISLV